MIIWLFECTSKSRPRDLSIGPLRIGTVVGIGLWQTTSDFFEGRKRGKKGRERKKERERESSGRGGRKVRCYLPKIRCCLPIPMSGHRYWLTVTISLNRLLGNERVTSIRLTNWSKPSMMSTYKLLIAIFGILVIITNNSIVQGKRLWACSYCAAL